MDIIDNKTIKEIVKTKFKDVNITVNDIINLKNELSNELNKKTSKLN